MEDLKMNPVLQGLTEQNKELQNQMRRMEEMMERFMTMSIPAQPTTTSLTEPPRSITMTPPARTSTATPISRSSIGLVPRRGPTSTCCEESVLPSP